MDREKRKKILIIWVLLTSILLTTTSYAWFTTSRVVTINSLNVHVAAEGGLEISPDAENWKAILSLNDIMNARDTYPNSRNQIPNLLEPVSTGGAIENGLLKLYYGTASNDGGTDFILTATRNIEEEGFGDETDGKFISFDVFFKVPSQKTIYLSSKAGVKYNGDTNTGIENAMRIAFLIQGNVPKDTPISTIQNLKGATSPYIWEPNYDVHTAYGVENALNVYGITTTMAGGRLLGYAGVIDEIKTSDNVAIQNATAAKYPHLFKNVTVDVATIANFTEYKEVFILEPGITKVRIYVWIEGQDVDCEDNASVGDVTIDIQLTTNPA